MASSPGAFPKKGSSILLLKLTNWRDWQTVIFQFSRWWQSLSSLPWCSGDLGTNHCNPIPCDAKMRKRWGAQGQSAARGVQNVNFNEKWLLKCIRRITKIESNLWKIPKRKEFDGRGCRNFEWNWNSLENVCERFRRGSFAGLNWSRTLCPSKMAFKNWSAALSGSEGTGRLAPCVFLGRRRSWDFKSPCTYVCVHRWSPSYLSVLSVQRQEIRAAMKEAKVERNSLSFFAQFFFFNTAMSIHVNTMSGWHHSQALSWKSYSSWGRNPSMCCAALEFHHIFENAVEAQKMEHVPCAFPQHRHLLQHGDSISWHFSWGSGGGASGWRQLFETLLLAYILRLICELCSKWSNPDLDTSQWYCSTAVVPHSWARSDEPCIIVTQEQTSSDISCQIAGSTSFS